MVLTSIAVEQVACDIDARFKKPRLIPVVANKAAQGASMRTFGLDAMLFVVLLTAVTLAVGREFPWFAAALGFVSAVAAGRTGYLAHRIEMSGEIATRSKKLALFADSLALASLALVGMGFGVLGGALVGAFGLGSVLVFCSHTKMASRIDDWFMYGSIAGGLIGGCYAFFRMQLDLWRYQGTPLDVESDAYTRSGDGMP